MRTSETNSPVGVIFLHSSDELYGSDRVLLQIVKGLDRTRFRPIVVLPEDTKHIGLLSAELSREGIEFHHLPLAILRRQSLTPLGIFQLFGMFWRGSFAVRRLARTTNARIIYGFTFAVIAAPVAALVSQLPLVMHAHEVLVRPSIVRRVLHKFFTSRAKIVACISNAVRENIRKDEPLADSKLRVVYNGLAPLPDSSRTRDSMRRELSVPEGVPLVGMIGRVSHWKGQGVLLRAAAQLRDAGVKCHFVSIGGVFGNSRKPLDELLALRLELGMEAQFFIEDFRSDASELIRCFDIFVLPSTLPEPFGMVILEAMDAGVPVIASAHGGPLEILVAGETGLLVPPSNPEALAAGIGELLSDPDRRVQIGRAGREHLEKHFSLNSQIQGIQNLLDEVGTTRDRN